MIDIEIDGKTLQTEEGTMIIEAADKAGIYIPRFCYHKKLTIAANCRMCLIEVEKSGKPLPACATPVSSGMKVFTRSQKALQAQRAVMEFLLINHPLDCPICDQGGECELQDLSLGFGRADSNYNEAKRSVKSDNIGPLIDTWMTRCIHCTRCVRFGEEVAGLRELGLMNRGEKAEIGTYVKHFMRSELSGNIIDLCPVGALTNRPARYSGRGWEYQEHPTVAPHDCVGSNVFVHSRGQVLLPARQIMRAVPRECEHINENWISDRDRYSVHALYSSTRIYKPRIKRQGQWIEVEWETALDEIQHRVKHIIDEQGANQVGAIASSNATVEEFYLLQKMLRSLGSNNVDHRQRECDFRDQASLPAFPLLNMKIDDIEKLDAILLVGSNVRFEQPMINHRINKAVTEGATVMTINSMDYEFNYVIQHQHLVPPHAMVKALAEVRAALQASALNPISNAELIAHELKNKKNIAIFLGEHALGFERSAELRHLASEIAELTQAKLGFLTAGANGAGAWLAGCIPHRGPAAQALESPGLSAKDMFCSHPLAAYFLLNTEPECDSAYSGPAQRALEQAKLVVCCTPFVSDNMQNYADFILPIAPFTETAGTFINVTGEWQSFRAATVAHQDAKPGWKVLRVLANFLQLAGFEYETVLDVLAEIKQKVANMNSGGAATTINFQEHMDAAPQNGQLYRLGFWPIYNVDNLVRRSAPLQEALVQESKSMAINATTAKQLNLAEGDFVTVVQGEDEKTFPLLINNKLATNTVLLPSGIPETAGFGQSFAPIELRRDTK